MQLTMKDATLNQLDKFLDSVDNEQPARPKGFLANLLQDGPFGPQHLASALGIALSAWDDNPRAKRAGRYLALGSVGLRIGQAVHDWKTKPKKKFIVRVTEDDLAFIPIMRWMLDKVEPAEQRSVLITTLKARRDGPDNDYSFLERSQRGQSSRTQVLLNYDSQDTLDTELEGHKVSLRLVKGGNVKKGEDDSVSVTVCDQFIFSADTVEGRDAALRLIYDLAEKFDTPKPCLYVMEKYGGWNARRDIPARSLDTVILQNGQREELIDDIREFLQSEHLYGQLGLPWHRGYVFEGPPGTGKSSLAKALATEFGMNVFYASLGDIEKDADLLRGFSALGPRSILLLEDVDVLGITVKRDGEDRDTSLSALLNALDGLATPHGLITIMTTNDINAIDPVLLRPGRADKKIHVGYLDQDQAERLAGMVVGQKRLKLPKLHRDDLSAAEFLEVVKPHLHESVDKRKAYCRLAAQAGLPVSTA